MNARRLVAIRFSEEELVTAKALAEKYGLEFSEYVRQASTGQLMAESEQIELLQKIYDEVKKLHKKK